MTEDVLEFIYNQIKDAPLRECPYKKDLKCDNPMIGTKNFICVWLDDCLQEWIDNSKNKNLNW